MVDWFIQGMESAGTLFSEARRSQKAMASNNQPRTVVVIEDDPEMIELVKLILAKDGFTVIGANNGRDGLGVIAEYNPGAVLLDLMMPDMDGWEVTRP